MRSRFARAVISKSTSRKSTAAVPAASSRLRLTSSPTRPGYVIAPIVRRFRGPRFGRSFGRCQGRSSSSPARPRSTSRRPPKAAGSASTRSVHDAGRRSTRRRSRAIRSRTRFVLARSVRAASSRRIIRSGAARASGGLVTSAPSRRSTSKANRARDRDTRIRSQARAFYEV
jgi:hypothetical protein